MRHPALEQAAFAPMTLEQANQFRSLVLAALAEDGALDDVTSQATLSPEAQAAAELVLRSEAVVAGLQIAALAFRSMDPGVAFEALVEDGTRQAGGPIAQINGAARSLLAAERVALNFLGRLSGIATLTRAYVAIVQDSQSEFVIRARQRPA
jgi:nicotinate-nucleotide pyrophosphorylase (carboxylating)